MRPRIDDYDDFDDADYFAFERSQALQKLLDEFRREERGSHNLENFKGRRHHADWSLDEDEDWY